MYQLCDDNHPFHIFYLAILFRDKRDNGEASKHCCLSTNKYEKDDWFLILITKEESNLIRDVYPDAGIARTMKQRSKRHRYYLTEDEKYLRLIVSSNSAARDIIKEVDDRRSHFIRNKRWH